MLLRNKSILLLFSLSFFVIGNGLCFASTIERRANDTISLSLLQKITNIIHSRMSGNLSTNNGSDFIERSVAISEMADGIDATEAEEIINYIALRLPEIGETPTNAELKIERTGLIKLRKYLKTNKNDK